MHYFISQTTNALINTVQALSSKPFLLIATTISLAIKTYIISQLFVHRKERQTKFQQAWLSLILILLGSITEDLAWIIKLTKALFFPCIDYRIIIFALRIAWAFVIIQYQALSLLIDNLISSHPKRISIINWIFLAVSAYYCGIFLWLAVFNTFTLSRPNIEFNSLNQITAYIPIIIAIALLQTLIKLHKTKTPKILRKQLHIFIWGLIVPRVLSDIIQVYPFNFVPDYVASNYAVIGLSSLLITYTAYFCINKLLKLRFLNVRPSVISNQSENPFMGRFKILLEQLSTVINQQELYPIVKSYFHQALNIAEGRTKLYLRHTNNSIDFKAQVTEFFIDSNQPCVEFIARNQIVVLDELEFNEFYQNDNISADLLTFLRQINCEMFISICQENHIIAYIIIEQDPYSKKIYSNIERDEISVFTQYLGSIINLMQKRNLTNLVEQEKQLKEELYHKHQQVTQYKESIRSFIKQAQNSKFGIVFYKARRFTIGNQDANEIVNFNINTQPGHPLAKKLLHIAKQVETYKSPQTCFAKDHLNKNIIITGIPSLDQSSVIITMHYPDITDIVKKQLDLLTDPSQWDYLLYLETTQSGKLINQLIPGSNSAVLDFKIELLKASLSKKAILINSSSQEDLKPTVELIHQISLRQNLSTLNLHGPSDTFETAIQLFGINPIFEASANTPLLQSLNQFGTLFIKNVHYLNLETQNYLADFIKYGFYRVFRSEQKVFSDVRIICSTDQNLHQLIHEGLFSNKLYQELQSTCLTIPDLTNLSAEAVTEIIEETANNIAGNGTFKDLLVLNDKEKHFLINNNINSIQILKEKIQILITAKSKINLVQIDTQLPPDSILHDPKLADILKLGKYALKDREALFWLWNKFQNQNKIASLLNVNRSSVQRRCKEFGFY